MFSILKYTNNQRDKEIFQPLFMCFRSLFYLVLRLFQPPNQGADNSETSVAWTFMQLFFRQCFKCAWSNKKITKNVGPHVGPTSFPSRSLTIVCQHPKSFSLEVLYTGAQGTWSDGLPMTIPLLWKYHEPNAQGTFRMGKPEYACLPIPIYRLLRSFQFGNVCSDVGAIKLCWWTIPRKQSCRCIHTFVNSINIIYTPQSLWPLSQSNLGGCISWMPFSADQAPKVCWTDDSLNWGFMVHTTRIS